MADRHPEGPFFTERRLLGLFGASVLATAAYGLVTGITVLNAVVFFVIFAIVFTVLNYALFRYD